MIRITKANKVVSKLDIERISTNLIGKVESGRTSAIEALAQLASMQKIIEKAREGIMPVALNEFDRWKDGSSPIIKVGSYEAEVMETAIKYDYSNDPIWLSLTEQIAQITEEQLATLEEARKQRENELKMHFKDIRGGIVIDVNPFTGEQFFRLKPNKFYKCIVKYTLKT